MESKKVLQTSLILMVFIALAFACSPFINSLKPNEQAKANERIEILLSSIPDNKALEIDWHLSKVFIVKHPEIKAFKIPFERDKYWLPDPTWESSRANCNQIVAKNNTIQCTDSDGYSKDWLAIAQWDFSGKKFKGSSMPNLLPAPFMVTEQTVVISKAFESNTRILN